MCLHAVTSVHSSQRIYDGAKPLVVVFPSAFCTFQTVRLDGSAIAPRPQNAKMTSVFALLNVFRLCMREASVLTGLGETKGYCHTGATVGRVQNC